MLSQAIIDLLNNAMPASQVAQIGNLMDEVLSNGIPFVATAKISATSAGTAVVILPDSSVTRGRQVFITDLLLVVSSSTAWTDVTATKLSITDTNGTPVSVVDIAKAGLTANAIINALGGTNQTLGTNIVTGVGLTASKGIQIKGDANFTAGSDIYVTVSGVIK